MREPMEEPTEPELLPELLAELNKVEAKLARTQAKSRRRHKALRSLNRAIQRRSIGDTTQSGRVGVRPIIWFSSFTATVIFTLGMLCGAILMGLAR